MNHRQRMLAAIRGEPADQIPWAPRLDLWSIAQQARGALSKEYRGLDTAGLADAFGVACHAQRADYTQPRDPRDLALRGLGIDNHPDYPYRVELRSLPVEFHTEGDSIITRIRTPAGEVNTRLTLTDEMRRNGISLPLVEDFAIRSADDLNAVAEVFEHLEVIPTPDAYAAFRRRIGDRGLAVANGIIGASPMHLIFHDIASQEDFIYLYNDQPEKLKELARRMEPFYEKILAAVTACEAESVYWGCNYDENLTWPAFFEEEISPWLRKVSERLHAAGQFVLTHTDGENRRLMPLCRTCGFDIADSVCPRPMTRCTLKELRDGMGSGITVWGGLCSIAFLDDSMDEAGFRAFLDETFSSLGTGERLILGVSDMVPPNANLQRLEHIKERVHAFGPVCPVR